MGYWEPILGDEINVFIISQWNSESHSASMFLFMSNQLFPCDVWSGSLGDPTICLFYGNCNLRWNWVLPKRRSLFAYVSGDRKRCVRRHSEGPWIQQSTWCDRALAWVWKGGLVPGSWLGQVTDLQPQTVLRKSKMPAHPACSQGHRGGPTRRRCEKAPPSTPPVYTDVHYPKGYPDLVHKPASATEAAALFW